MAPYKILDSALDTGVSSLLRTVASEVVMPSFCALSKDDIFEKSPGEIVTRVDREAEVRLHDGLAALRTGARVIGEEACAQDPALLASAGEGLVWLVDPLDGTANFAGGRRPFGLMVALVAGGLPLAGWILDPSSGRLCRAARGEGARINDRPIRVCAKPSVRPVAALATQFMTPDQREHTHACAGRLFSREPIPRCAAESYPRLVLGLTDVALFQRILPWDHAAGVLLVQEAGGWVTHWDGHHFKVGGPRTGLLVASSHWTWAQAHAVLAPALEAIMVSAPSKAIVA